MYGDENLWMDGHRTQQHNTVRVICKILRRRPCQNFLPGVLCVTQCHRITYRYVPQGCLWVESSSIDSGPVRPCGPVPFAVTRVANSVKVCPLMYRDGQCFNAVLFPIALSAVVMLAEVGVC